MSGFRYFLRGLRLLGAPGVRGFVLIPLLVNLLIFAALSWYILDLTGALASWITDTLGAWAQWLLWLVWLVVGTLWLIIYGYSFSLISNTIAAPFYGLLAEKVQVRITGVAVEEPLTLATFAAMVKRSFIREWQKLRYLLPRLLLLVLVSLPLYFIPVVGMLVPAAWFLWGAWSLCLQNIDFAADNNLMTFADMKAAMKQQRVTCLSFGGAAVIAASIPVFNMLAVPAAVAGGTALWLDRWQQAGFTGHGLVLQRETQATKAPGER